METEILLMVCPDCDYHVEIEGVNPEFGPVNCICGYVLTEKDKREMK